MKIKAVKFRENGFMHQAFAFGGEEGADKFDEVKDYVSEIENLYLVGRNGMHKYNNMNHSALTAMKTVDSILGLCDKSEIWDVNTETEYYEEKK